jgi:hypothetical protein
MSFFDWPVEDCQPSEGAQKRRRRTAARLIRQFASAFQEIEYELFWEVPLINAQAWCFGRCRRVRVYGGLVRHSSMTACGLSLMLAHETGHHLGGPPLDPDLRWPTWQGQADYWAATEGMPKVFGDAARRLTLRGANEIVALHRDFSGDEADVTPDERLAIFRAGALGETAPSCLQAAFDRMIKERNSRKMAIVTGRED